MRFKVEQTLGGSIKSEVVEVDDPSHISGWTDFDDAIDAYLLEGTEPGETDPSKYKFMHIGGIITITRLPDVEKA